MLTKAQEKLIKSLHTKKGRQKAGLCLVEGKKNIELAGDLIEYKFTKEDSSEFDKLVTTETPQEIAGVAKIPEFTLEDIKKHDTVVVLDNIQDPGNVGTISRLCLGFDASLLLINSVDPTSPKVIRSSAGAVFQVPWMKTTEKTLQNFKRKTYRLEKRTGAKALTSKSKLNQKCIIIAGNEGQGIKLDVKGDSIFINHNKKLESLNVASALSIILHHKFNI
ncbi:RNA methyltransferase [Candidatus Falkowbacteria bacterium]|jgi:RNA methyltransferase, TrmH family|nr:RNA methyltransferase [Candidatus Falkowbacteria bacterium]